MLSAATALRGVRVLSPAAAAELPRLSDDVAAARHRIARAEAERLALLDSVRDAAHQLGLRAGHAQAVEELARFNTDLRALASDHASALQALLLRALRRLLGELPPDLVLAQLVEQALSAARDEATKVQVHVHPRHCAAVSERLRARDGLAIDVRADASLGPADCRIDTGVGSIDAGLPTQLAALEAALSEAPSDDHA
jgi:type III secretion protein L